MKTLDPSDPRKKKQIKASITAAIAKAVVGSNCNEIAQKVDDVYERLLIGAIIFTHIPSLTAGLVRREVMASNRGELKRNVRTLPALAVPSDRVLDTSGAVSSTAPTFNVRSLGMS